MLATQDTTGGTARAADTLTRHDQHGRYPQAETVDDFRHHLATVQARIAAAAHKGIGETFFKHERCGHRPTCIGHVGGLVALAGQEAVARHVTVELDRTLQHRNCGSGSR